MSECFMVKILTFLLGNLYTSTYDYFYYHEKNKKKPYHGKIEMKEKILTMK